MVPGFNVSSRPDAMVRSRSTTWTRPGAQTSEAARGPPCHSTALLTVIERLDSTTVTPAAVLIATCSSQATSATRVVSHAAFAGSPAGTVPMAVETPFCQALKSAVSGPVSPVKVATSNAMVPKAHWSPGAIQSTEGAVLS